MDDTEFEFWSDRHVDPVPCGVCGTLMAPRFGSFSQECPVAYNAWHRQAVLLREEANRTPSGRLARFLRDEALDVIRSKTPTKETS